MQPINQFRNVDPRKVQIISYKEHKIKKIPVEELPGKMRLLKFFLGDNWHKNICAVKASKGGAKGGVIYLYKTIGEGFIQPAKVPSYVVKLTDAPQQTLLAEFVLRKYANAKVPKALVIDLDWDVYPDDFTNINLDDKKIDAGQKLVSIITNPKSIQLFGSNENYEKCIARLKKNAPDRPKYLLVMKCFPVAAPVFGDKPSTNPCKSVISNPFSIAMQKYQAYSLSRAGWSIKDWMEENGLDVNKTSFANLTTNHKDDPKFQRIIWEIIINKYILTNEELMKRAGSLLFWDTVIGNGDRIQGAGGPNTDNLFFTNKKYSDNSKRTQNKIDFPIALIDNECMMPIYNPARPPVYELGYRRPGEPQQTLLECQISYVNFVLGTGTEILVGPGLDADKRLYSDPATKAPLPNIVQLIKGFDSDYFLGNKQNKNNECNSFFRNFVSRFFEKSSPLLEEIYWDDGTLFGLPGSYPKLLPDHQDPCWQTTQKSLKLGFDEALKSCPPDFCGIEGEFFCVYWNLVCKYGLTLNFDITASNVRVFCLKEQTTDTSKIQDHIDVLAKRYEISDFIKEAVNFAQQKKWISEEQANEILRLMSMAPIEGLQTSFCMGKTMATGAVGEIRRARLHTICFLLVLVFTKWLSLKIEKKPFIQSFFYVCECQQLLHQQYLTNFQNAEKGWFKNKINEHTSLYRTVENLIETVSLSKMLKEKDVETIKGIFLGSDS